jgi:hypothetical protein
VKRHQLLNGLAAILVVAVVAWIASNTYWEAFDAHLGPRGDALTNPFYAAQRLASLLGTHTQLRHEIVATPSPDAVIVLGDWNWSVIPERRERFERWVREGGRLVVARGLLADPQFNAWTGVSRERAPDGEPSSCGAGASCDSVTMEAGKATKRWDICDLAMVTYLGTTRKVSWRLNDTRSRAQALRVPIGRGSVTIINADPFREQGLTCGDNALLFVAATQLKRGDSIVFLTEENADSLLQLIWRYGSPVVVLIAVLIMLWLWRSGVRFGPLLAEPDPARRSLAEQIRGTGQFTLRFGGGRALHAAAVRALDETAARLVPHYDRLTGEERITALVPLTGFGTSELSGALDRASARNSHELRKAIATLELGRRHMTQTKGLEHAD